jgi:hypothetical protein
MRSFFIIWRFPFPDVGAVISQDNCQIAFYSHKLQLAQVRYTTTETELLLIIKTLTEF